MRHRPSPNPTTTPSVRQPAHRSVIVVSLGRAYGGVDVRVEATCRALAGVSHRAFVLSGSELHLRLSAVGEDVVASSRGRWNPVNALQLMRLARRNGPATLDAHNVQSQLWSAVATLLSPGTRLVATVHSSYSREYPSGPRRLLFPLTIRLCRRAGARFIAVSPAVVEWLHDLGVPAHRVNLIENAPDAPADRDPALRRELGLQPDDLVLCSVGRLVAVKGHEHLLEALALVAPSTPSVRLLIVGDGPLRGALEERSVALGLADRVIFTGFRRDVPRLLASADVFCLPSLSEGLPFAALEAAAAGLPIVASDVGGMGQLLGGTDAGLLVPPADPVALTAALRDLVESPEARQRLGAAGRALVAARYSHARMEDETVAALAGGPPAQVIA